MTRTQRTYVVAAAVAAIVTAANSSEGAYFSQSWGWIALAFLVPSTLLLILDRTTVPGRLRIAFAALMGALGVWIAMSSLWSISPSASVREAERMLVYVALALAVAVVLRRGDATAVLAGALTGVTIVSAYGLATRLFQDRFDTYDDPRFPYRLAEPLGYWNALGLLASIGLILAFGFVAHARRMHGSIAAAAAVPVTATTLYFAFSRGAWGALALGLVAAIVLDPRRVRLLWSLVVVAAPATVCIAYASQQDALTTEGAAPAAAVREGHRLAVVVIVAVVGSCLAAWGARTVARHVPWSRSARRTFDVVLASVAVAGVVAAVVAAGGPTQTVTTLKERFDVVATFEGPNLNSRLFDLSGNGRTEQLVVAWDASRDQPLVGQGAGIFEYVWYERRPTSIIVVRDAHTLYLETLVELGVVGLALLSVALLVLLTGAIRARRMRFVGAGAGAFIAWMVASAFDWHWEMVGVTLTALLVAAAGMLASERHTSRVLEGRTRPALIGATIALSVFGVVSLVGNQALFAGREKVARGDWREAASDARRARALLPWSYEPDIVLGDAAAGAGDRAGAVRAFRDAVAEDPQNWVAWLRLAQVARGPERATAYDRVHELNPLEKGLPGE